MCVLRSAQGLSVKGVKVPLRAKECGQTVRFAANVEFRFTGEYLFRTSICHEIFFGRSGAGAFSYPENFAPGARLSGPAGRQDRSFLSGQMRFGTVNAACVS